MSTYDMTQPQLNELLATTVNSASEAIIQQYLQSAALYPVRHLIQVEYDPPSVVANTIQSIPITTEFYINTLSTSYDPLTDTMTGYTDTLAPANPIAGPVSAAPVESFNTVNGQFIAAGDTTVKMIDETGGISALLADTLVGGAGNDKITAVQGYNVLVAGTGANTLHGGTGFDSLYGGGDSYLTTGSGNDSLYGIGADTLNAGNVSSGNIAFLQANAASTHVTMYGGVAAGSVSEMDDILSSGNDFMKSNAGNDSIWGGNGNDTIKAGSGDDHIWDGTGSETIYGAQAGGMDKTMLDGGGSVDFIGGQGGTDHLNVGPTGDDTVTGGGQQHTAVNVFNSASFTENSVTIGGQAYQEITFTNGQTLTVKGVTINFLPEGTHQIVP